MKKSEFIPAVVFGALLGSLVTLSLRDPQRLPISLIPSLVTGLTTIVVGWWIHSAVRRRGELDRIPMEYLSDLNRRIGDLISACFGTAGDEQLLNIRRLGIEINGLREFARQTTPPVPRALEEALGWHYIDFKRHLTDTGAVDKGLASKAGSEIRMTALKIQWRLSRHFLDRTTDDPVLVAD